MIAPLSMNVSTAIGARKPAENDPNSLDARGSDVAIPFLLPNFAQPIVPTPSADARERSDYSVPDDNEGEASKNALPDMVQTVPGSLPNLPSQAQAEIVDLNGVTANPIVIDPAKLGSMIKPFDQMPKSGKAIDAGKSGTAQLSGNNNDIFAKLRGKLLDSPGGQNTPPRFQVLKVDIGPMFSVSDPKVFTPVAKTEGAATAVGALNDVPSDADPVNSNNLVAQLKQSDLGPNEHELDQSKPNEPIKIDVQENSTASFADNLMAAATKRSSSTNAETPTSNLTRGVFEQVEPRIIGLAGLTQNGADKRILKMRLNPAELGTVEITLEKNSSGSISAHFQTESERTRQILGESLAQLRISLENSGWQVGDLNISCNPSLSHGGGAHGDRSQSFGKAEQRAVLTTNSDGVLTNEGDKEDRLVNLRA